jgi:hypothetical protein
MGEAKRRREKAVIRGEAGSGPWRRFTSGIAGFLRVEEAAHLSDRILFGAVNPWIMSETRRTAIDREVGRLVEKLRGDSDVTLDEILGVCPFRSLMGAADRMSVRARAEGVLFVLGFGPASFSRGMPADVAELLLRIDAFGLVRAGRFFLLVSDQRQARDAVKRELVFAAKEGWMPIDTVIPGSG